MILIVGLGLVRIPQVPVLALMAMAGGTPFVARRVARVRVTQTRVGVLAERPLGVEDAADFGLFLVHILIVHHILGPAHLGPRLLFRFLVFGPQA